MPHAGTKNLDKLFNPASIAVIGASRDPKKIGNITIRNLLDSGYKGEIYPINPKALSIHGQKVYPALEVLPKTPDLLVISIPSGGVLYVLQEAVKLGIKNYVIFTAGFKEIGFPGDALEHQIVTLAQKHNLNILGPNCLGFANIPRHINATFGKVSTQTGKLKFISQSGAIAAAIFDWADYANIGFDEFVTLGNKADINENHLLEHWYTQLTKEYTPVGMYLESISDGRRFIDLAKTITKTSPIFVLKPGKSHEAQQAMQSHTGALAGEDIVMDSAFKQAGIIRCEGLQDMFDLVRTFSWSNNLSGPNVAIVSNAGGPAVISADFVSKYGLQLAPISKGNQKYLSEHLPRSASLLNPVDVLGDALADRYKIAIETVLKQKDVDSILVLLTPQVMTEIKNTAEVIADLRKKSPKPIFCAFIGGNQVTRGQQILNREHIPSFAFPERAIKAISKLWEWNHQKQHRKEFVVNMPIHGDIKHLVDFAKDSKRTALSGLEVDFILNKLGFDTPPTREITAIDTAKRFAQAHGWPVVLKFSSDKILHKSESGGIILNINSEHELEIGFEKIFAQRDKLTGDIKNSTSLQIQKQVKEGLEVIIGVKRDPTFGYVMMFGAGGIYTEILKDTNLSLLPMDRRQIMELVESSKVYPLLKGARGKQPYFLKGIFDVMEKVSHLVEAVPHFSSFEINPVIVDHGRVWLVDGKATL